MWTPGCWSHPLQAQAGGWPVCTCKACTRRTRQSEGCAEQARTRGAVQSDRAFGAGATGSDFLCIESFPGAPVCVRSEVWLCHLKPQAPVGLLLDTESVCTLRLSEMPLTHRDKRVRKRLSIPRQSPMLLPVHIRMQQGCPHARGSS